MKHEKLDYQSYESTGNLNHKTMNHTWNLSHWMNETWNMGQMRHHTNDHENKWNWFPISMAMAWCKSQWPNKPLPWTMVSHKRLIDKPYPQMSIITD